MRDKLWRMAYDRYHTQQTDPEKRKENVERYHALVKMLATVERENLLQDIEKKNLLKCDADFESFIDGLEGAMMLVTEMNKLAESRDMYAQYLMGKLWRDGPLLIPDSAEARYWFEQAAEQGHIVAQYSLAKLYLSDDLEVRDIRTGMDWLYTAATNGSHYAMYRLAKELLKGDLIERDGDAAVEWFTRSAKCGNQYAQYMLGKLYLTGKEVPRNEERAVYWLAQSAEQGNQYADYLLDHLEENRPPSVMLAVTRLLHHAGRIFQDNSVPKSRPGGVQIDRKRLKKLQEKRIALGHKPDDHEEQWPDMTM